MNEKTYFAHATACVDEPCEIGAGTKIWHFSHVMRQAQLGKNCILGQNVFVDSHVTIGNNVKIQNNASIYEGVTLEDGVFVGPHVCFTNDLQPRAINPDGSLKAATDWHITLTVVGAGAAIGANSTIRCGIRIGKWAMVGAGSVVTRDVPDYGLVYGTPARLQGYVCPCAERLQPTEQRGVLSCPKCQTQISIGQ
jgi:UDP-2-acetamido-3-amino-2,3-dideoxy-glucuronate N-acetyltransferase